MHSAILSTFIEIPFVIKFFVLYIFEWPFYTGLLFTQVYCNFFLIPEKESSRTMSTESVKGSEADNLTTSSEAQNEPKQENSQSHVTSSEEAGKTTDSEGEAKIKADAEEAEKQRSPRSASAGSRTGSDKEGDGTDEQKGDVQSARSRSSSGGRKSPGGTSRPRSSESRPKSTTSSRGSGEVTFEAKAKHRKKKKAGDLIFIEGHQVTFTVTISVAIPTGKT